MFKQQPNNMLPRAKATTHTVAGTLYEGANPVYRNMAGIGQPANWIKVSAGVPFRRAGAAFHNV